MRSQMEKLAIIDMGSNSIRFIAIQIYDNHAYSFLYQQKESIRLGEGLTSSDRLSEAGMERAMKCLKVYRHMIDVMEIKTCLAVATAAVRVASNGDAFITKIHAETGIRIRVIPGEEEAALGYLGVINTIDMADFLQFDLGGASVEITLVRDRQVVHSVSVPIGAVTLTEKYALQDAPSLEQIEKCRQSILRKLKNIPWLHKFNLPIIGIGGTVRNIAKMDQKSTNYPLPRMHNYRLPKERFEDIYEKVCSRNCAARKKIPGLSNERADIIIAGALVIKSLLEHTGGNELIISGNGLREGIFYEYYGSHYNHGDIIVKDMLTFSTENFLKTLGNINKGHIEQVTHVACELFDKTKKLHQYGGKEKRLLMTAARLHDVGKVINYYNHARHSAFMIGNAQLYGLTQLEQFIAAFIAGYHHGISNKTFNAYRYSSMVSKDEWTMIRQLSTLLALAEASDVTYEHFVEKVDVSIKKDLVSLTFKTTPGQYSGAADFEMASLLKQFKKEFNKQLIIHWA